MNRKEGNRIWFKDNPWPNGHALKESRFYGVLSEEGIHLHLEIKTEDYYADQGFEAATEQAEEHDRKLEEEGVNDDWKMYSAWMNYHSCHIQPNKRVLLGNKEQPFRVDQLANWSFRLDDPPPIEETWKGLDFDNMYFHCYVLGHDAVAHHEIDISSAEKPFHYHIDWKGKVALAYFGDEEFRYTFTIHIRDIEFEGFDGQHRLDLRFKDEAKQQSYWYDTRLDRSMEEREQELRNWMAQHAHIPDDQLIFSPLERSDWLRFI